MESHGVGVHDGWRHQRFDEGLQLGLGSIAEQPQVFRVYPPSHVDVSDHSGAGVREDAVPGDVIRVVMRVDHELHRQLGAPANFRQKVGRGSAVGECVDDRDPVIANHKSGVCVRWLFGVRIVNGGKDARPNLPEDERGLDRRLRPYGGGFAQSNEQDSWKSNLLDHGALDTCGTCIAPLSRCA